MKKEDKEKFTLELRFKELEQLNKGNFMYMYRYIGLIAAGFAFLLSQKIVPINEKAFFVISMCFLIFLIYFLLMGNRQETYYEDHYEDLFRAIKNNKVLEFRYKDRTFVEKYIHYKSRY